MPIVRIDKPEEFVGMEINKAKTEIAARGYESRLVWTDGRTIVPEYMMGSKVDYDPLRVNLYVKDGKVTRAVIA